MPILNPKIDAYIAKSADFARPILNHLRALIHTACPEVEETVKWGMPHFEAFGAVVCHFAAFKQHCALGFWKASLMSDPHDLFEKESKTAMGIMGQIRSLDDLPSDKILSDYIKEAARLNKEEIKRPTKKPAEKKELDIPDYFFAAIGKNPEALRVFEGFSYSNKKEYVEWVTTAKTEETKQQRLATTVEWLAEGKVKNWKYVKK